MSSRAFLPSKYFRVTLLAGLTQSLFWTTAVLATPPELVNFRSAGALYPNIMLTVNDSSIMNQENQQYFAMSDWPSVQIKLPGISAYFHEGTQAGGTYYGEVLPEWRNNDNITWRNIFFYDHKITYKPWPGQPDAPVTQTFQEMNQHFQNTKNENFYAVYWMDTAGYTEYYSDKDSYTEWTYHNYKSGANGELDYWDDRLVIKALNNGTITLEEHRFNGTPSGRERFTEIVTTPTTSSWMLRSNAAEAQNIANWFKYHRTRIQKVKYALGELLEKYPHYYYGLSTYNEVGNFTPIRSTSDQDAQTYNQALRDKIYAIATDNVSSPTTKAFTTVGEYFKNGITLNGNTYESPVKHACQVNINFAMGDTQTTDWNSSWNPDLKYDFPHGDVDGDGAANMIADVGRYYYMTDLAPDLPDVVPEYQPVCSNPAVPHVKHQHLSQYFLTFKAQSSVHLYRDSTNCWPRQNMGITSYWRTGYMEDVYHSAFNSRGLYRTTTDFNDIFEHFDKVFGVPNSIIHNPYFALNSFLANESTMLYLASSDVAANQGFLYGLSLNKDNEFKNKWEAGALLASNSSRHIFSYNTNSNKGVSISSTDTGSLFSNDQKTRLGSLAATFGSSLHGQGLGSVINSDITYVGKNLYQQASELLKAKSYPGQESYAEYHQKRQEAKPMVYVGSFDNMLHGFDASTGKEIFAYVPAKLLDENMFDAGTNEQNIGVDGGHYVTDVYSTQKGWQTILIGGLRRGGQGYYALNISDPDNFSKDSVLWEFSDSDSTEMGLSFARPAAGTFENGTTYAVLANGLNNAVSSDDDQNTSSSGKPSLFIVNALTGDIVKTFTGRKGTAEDPGGSGQSNGFAEPALVDSDNNGLIDTIYVGDWFGELYAFDVSDSQSRSWNSFAGTSGDFAKPLVEGNTIENRAITTRPVVTQTQISDEGAIKTANILIYASGQNYTQDVPTQTEYLAALIHDTSGETTQQSTANLQQVQVSVSGDFIYAESQNLDMEKPGWIMKFKDSLAEYAVVQNMQIISGELQVTLSKKPGSAAASCSGSGGGTYSLVLDPRTGGPTKGSVFLDENGKRQQNDEELAIGQHYAAGQSAVQSVLGGNGKTYNLSIQDGQATLEERGALNAGDGRQSWRRLY